MRTGRDENEVVPQVVDALLQVPDTAHVAVRHTTLLVLGELSEWIDKHPPVVGRFTSCFDLLPVSQYIICFYEALESEIITKPFKYEPASNFGLDAVWMW